MMSKMQKGFTLIELMIVVAVIAILSAIAYPAYTSSILKGKRAQARTALLDLLQQQERFMTQRNCYFGFTNTSGVVAATAVTSCGITATTPVPFKTFSGDNSTSPYYWLSAAQCDPASASPTLAECVRVIATPTGSDPIVNVLSLTSTGVKACNGTASGTSTANLCWP